MLINATFYQTSSISFSGSLFFFYLNSNQAHGCTSEMGPILLTRAPALMALEFASLDTRGCSQGVPAQEHARTPCEHTGIAHHKKRHILRLDVRRVSSTLDTQLDNSLWRSFVWSAPTRPGRDGWANSYASSGDVQTNRRVEIVKLVGPAASLGLAKLAIPVQRYLQDERPSLASHLRPHLSHHTS